MADIKKAAEAFAKENIAKRGEIPRGFFREMKKSIGTLEKTVGKFEIRDYRAAEFLIAAKRSLCAFKKEKIIDVSGEKPFIFLLAKSYLEATGADVKNSPVKEFLSAAASYHDFKISELTLFYNAFVLALADMYARSDDNAGRARCIGAFASLERIRFEDLYIKLAKVHMIFSGERAGVYKNLSRDTVAYYDEALTEKYSDEIAGAEEILRRADTGGEHVGKYLIKRKTDGGRAYFWLLSVLFACNFIIIAAISNILVALMAALPAYALSKEAARLFFERRQSFMPRLSSGKALFETRCTVAVTTLLCGEGSDGEIFDNIEDFYLQNKQDNFTFCVLGDLKESERRRAGEDRDVIKYAVSRIEALNKKYGAHFALFIRRRRFAVCERKYFGWERKRGAVLELCRYAKGDDGSFETVIGGELVRGSKYLLTLDSDTKLGISSVKDMLGIMLHPQNVAVIDKRRGKVVSGYGIIQPKMAVSLSSANRSAFASLSGGEGGTDRYSAASFDLYQDVFGRGIYCGKGMIDVDVFLNVCDGFFPKERILSHDLLEGSLAGAAAAKGIILTDSTPKTARAYFSRLERWIRGDLQAFSYAFKTVKNEAGEKIKNPMGWLSRYQISDNILRAATPVFDIALLMICSITKNYAALYPLIYIFAPLLKTSFALAFGRARQNLFSVKTALKRAALTVIFDVISLAAAAGTFFKAVVNVIYSALFSKRGFLSWTTAAELDHSRRDGFLSSIAAMRHSVVIGAAALVLPLPVKALGVIWAAFPIVSFFLGKERKKSPPVPRRAREKLAKISADIWKFFEDNVNESTNWLPPDNVQMSPVEAVAKRTSPTNIGLYFLAMLAARDLKIIDTDELCRRSSQALSSLEKMLKWNGHLYNWYDTDTLSVIGIPFVSSVDSGNFVTALVAFCEGIKEYVSENVNLIYVTKSAEKYIFDADFGALVDNDRELISVGYNVLTGSLSGSCYDTFMSEARTSAYFAEAHGAVSSGYFYSLGRTLISKRGKIGALSWSGTAFEFFMPSLLLPVVKNSFLSHALKFALKSQEKHAVRVPDGGYSVFGTSESCFFEFDRDMNYQYRAFGIDGLSIDPETHAERVISPYSSFLMMSLSPARMIKNLDRLKNAGMYGKYGFFEALDTEPSRVGGGYAVIKCFMAHHLGMSIVAAANVLCDDIFVRRFMRDPYMRSCRELLGEKVPTGVETLRRREKKRLRKTAVEHYRAKSEKKTSPPPTVLSPRVYMLSNNKTRVIASSSGHVSFCDGDDLIFSAPFDKFSLGNGLHASVFVDGIYISAVPLGYVSRGVLSEFSFDGGEKSVTYRSRHKKDGAEYALDMKICLDGEHEIIKLTLTLSGNFKEAEAKMYFEPVIDRADTFASHKSFSNLFIESAFYPDEGVLMYSRRPRSDGRPTKYLGVVADPPIKSDRFITRRDAVLPLSYGGEDISRIENYDGKTGACIVPACAVSSKFGQGRVSSAVFILGYSRNCDDLLYLLSSKNIFSSAKINAVQRAASGADEGVCELERLLLAKIMFPPSLKASGMAVSLSKMPVTQRNLWKHGISGDGPWICANLASDAPERTARLEELLRLFKYSCIRGMRYELIIIYRENDKYAEPVRRRILKAVSAAGLSSFLGSSRGIFSIDGATLTEGEKFVLTECAALTFDLSQLNLFSASDKYYVSMSSEWQRALVLPPKTSSAPKSAEKKQKRGTFGDGFAFDKNGDVGPWCHVLASRRFGTIVSENSLGFTFFENSALGKLTPHTADNMREDDGEKLIIRIYDGVDVSAFRDYDALSCAGSVKYSENAAEYAGTAENVRYAVKVSVCGDFPAKRVGVTLYGDGVFVDVILCVRPHTEDRPASVKNAVYYDDGKKAAFFAPVYRKEPINFRGILALRNSAGGAYTDEAALRSGGKIFGGTENICAVYDKAELSGEHTSAFFLCAVTSDEEEREIFEILVPSDGEAYKNEKLRSSPCVFTGKSDVDALINFWLPYQTVKSRLFAKAGFYQVGGAYGFRDQLQDVISLIPYDAASAREHIIRAASHQYEDGSVMHWWHEINGGSAGIRSRISDDAAWLSFALCEYVGKTGDFDVLKIKTPYLSSPRLSEEEYERYELCGASKREDTVLAHALAGLARTFRTGKHGLPLIGTGDWNDGMNCVGKKGRGESVWLAFFAALTAKRMSDLCRARKLFGEADELEAKSRALMMSSNDAFDGSWYIRGYYDDGKPLGSREREECKVDIMPQAFAAIASSEVGGEYLSKAKTALGNATSILFDRKSGVFKLLAPPFDKDDQSPGYIKGYVSGIRENGGQYTHAAVFAALGMLRAGMNREAAEVLYAICPTEKRAEIYKVEPYVIAGDVYSNADHVGRGGWSWYTGAAGWYRTVFIEELCGYRQKPNGFSVYPKFSAAFSGFTLKIEQKNTCYIVRASMSEKEFIVLDGKESENFFPFDGGAHEVEIFCPEKTFSPSKEILTF